MDGSPVRGAPCGRPAGLQGEDPAGRKGEKQTTARPPSAPPRLQPAPGPCSPAPRGSRQLLVWGPPYPSELDCPRLLQAPASCRPPPPAGPRLLQAPASCRPPPTAAGPPGLAVRTSRDVSHVNTLKAIELYTLNG